MRAKGFYEEDGAKFAYLMEYFKELREGVSSGINGPEMASWADFKAWLEVMKYNLSRLELEILRSLDRVYVEGLRSKDDH